MENNIELACFQIISHVGSARSSFIEAISAAKEKDFQLAEKLMEEGTKEFLEGHKGHSELITAEANEELGKVTLIMVHAEDQLMSAEGFKILANEFIDLYKRIG